eukprot:4449088-Pleurochrysis_carterae.AAC.1
MSWRSTLASCSGDITKGSLSSVVRARTEETGAAAAGAAEAVEPAGVDRVAGPIAAAAAAAAASARGNVNVGAIGDGESIVY